MPVMSAMIGEMLLSFPLQIIDGVQSNLFLGIFPIVGHVIFHR